MLKFKLEDDTNCVDVRPEVEPLPVTRDNRTEQIRRVSDRLTE